jgi:hypothetical protein
MTADRFVIGPHGGKTSSVAQILLDNLVTLGQREIFNKEITDECPSSISVARARAYDWLLMRKSGGA